MLDFIKTFLCGMEVVCLSGSSVACFVLGCLAFKYFVNAIGILAVVSFVGMVCVFIVGITLVWMLGVLIE